MFDAEEMSDAFCHCVDSYCPKLDWHDDDDDDLFMCGICEPDTEANVEVGVDVDCDSDMFELVLGIDDAEDDEFVTADYRSLRDVDG